MQRTVGPCHAVTHHRTRLWQPSHCVISDWCCVVFTKPSSSLPCKKKKHTRASHNPAGSVQCQGSVEQAVTITIELRCVSKVCLFTTEKNGGSPAVFVFHTHIVFTSPVTDAHNTKTKPLPTPFPLLIVSNAQVSKEIHHETLSISVRG